MKNPKDPKLLHNVLKKSLQTSLKGLKNLKVNVNQCPIVLPNGDLVYNVWFTDKTSKKWDVPVFHYSVVKLLAYLELVKKGYNSVKGL